MATSYSPKNCQSLFGYAQRVHERSGGICQLCGCGAGSEVDFDLWRQLTVEHLIGESQGGYAVAQLIDERFPSLSQAERWRLMQIVDDANTITACSFCNSTTSRSRAPKSLEALLGEAQGTPDEIVATVVQELGRIHQQKRRDVAWKIDAIRRAFVEQIEPRLRQVRS